MYIVISYCCGMAETANIMQENESNAVFMTRVEAEKYAVENCAWEYKIVNIGQ